MLEVEESTLRDEFEEFLQTVDNSSNDNSNSDLAAVAVARYVSGCMGGSVVKRFPSHLLPTQHCQS